jgi:hypothetical protein
MFFIIRSSTPQLSFILRSGLEIVFGSKKIEREQR